MPVRGRLTGSAARRRTPQKGKKGSRKPARTTKAAASEPVSELRVTYNKTGGFLDPVLARALREKEQDFGAPKQRTDVKRVGMRTIINRKDGPTIKSSATVQAEKVSARRDGCWETTFTNPGCVYVRTWTD